MMLRRLALVWALPLVTAAASGLPPAPGVTGLPAPGVSSLPPPATGAPAVVSPAPLPPPTAIAPAPSPGDGISPLLTQPGPIYPAMPSAGISAPPPAELGAINQQQLQSYRSNLQTQQRILEEQGVSPADPRLRDIQQQLNRPGQ